jgi:RimJ/RimL family protein N-acetyltransferase
MWPPVVVMVHVDAEDVLEVAAADDQEPVEALAADAADPALRVGVRVRRPHRRPDDFDAFAGEGGIERCGELAVAVVNEEAHLAATIVEVHQQVARLLPLRPARVSVFRTGRAGTSVYEVDGGNEAERRRGISHALPVPTGLRPPDPPLELADIVLRPPEPDDFGHLREASLHPEIEQTLWLPLPYRASEELLQDRLQEYLAGWDGRGAFGATLFAFARKTGEFVACLGMRACDGNAAELIYGVAPAWRNRGLAARLVRLVAEWLFAEGLGHVELWIQVDNRASRRVAEKVGFQQIRIERKVVAKTGEEYDDVLYELRR